MKNSHVLKISKGFTLMELLVSLAIIAFVAAIGIFNYRAYGQIVEVDRLANEVILTLREAQVYATSVKEFQPGTGNFYGTYGVHFHANEYLFYVYEDAVDHIVSATNPVPNGIIQQFYDSPTDTVPDLLTDSTVIFEKTKLNPIIRRTSPVIDGYRMELVLKSPNGLVERRVCIWASGRMYISKTTSC